MAAAARLGRPHGMLSIIGLSDAALEEACQKARALVGGDTVCRIANFLFPTGRVASGHKDALAEVTRCYAFGLKVSGHSSTCRTCFCECSLPLAGDCEKTQAVRLRAGRVHLVSCQ